MSTIRASNLRQLLKRIVVSAVLLGIALLALSYAIDFGIFRFRLATNRQPLGHFTVTRYYAVPQKNGKTEFIFDPPGPQTCSNSLFPQAGYAPCWYLGSHTDQRVNM